MSHESLKLLLTMNPNLFWDLVAEEGLSEAMLSVVDEVQSESCGDGMLENDLLRDQDL